MAKTDKKLYKRLWVAFTLLEEIERIADLDEESQTYLDKALDEINEALGEM